MMYSCKICTTSRDLNEMCVLNCKHSFCLPCLENYALDNISGRIKCPMSRCYVNIEETQLKEILSSEDLKKYCDIHLETLPGSYKCVLPQCGTINQCQSGAEDFICKNCFLQNCTKCKASHFEISCIMYKSLTQKQIDDKYGFQIEKAKQEVFKKIRKSISEAVKKDLFINDKVFECLLCLRCIGIGIGVKLRNCFDYICKPCLILYIQNATDIPIKCPYRNCTSTIEDREVNALLTKNDYRIYEKKGLDRGKSKISNGYQCQQPDCDYFCEFIDDSITKFRCPKCKTTNCVKCRAVHKGLNCLEYQKKHNSNELFIDESITKGKYMRCPDCRNLITKSHGCNWIKCPKCDLELCWIRRIPRWGPKGRGDTSGGCRCTAENLCHPKCAGCIPPDR